MPVQIPLDESARAAETVDNDHVHQVAPDLAYRRLMMVNVVFYGLPGAGDRQWVLVDTGVPGSRQTILNTARERFGEGTRPAAIILTHGHFDHVGSVVALAEEWDVPVHAHTLEFPYLNGTEKYPPPNPGAGGGLTTLLSPLFPREPVDLRPRLSALPPDGTVPHMPGWRWIHTPGHAPGHVSLWHEQTRSLLAGDAIVTTGQESAYGAATQEPEMHGPPRYFTPDWEASHRSVVTLAALEPELVVTGHGRAMAGPEMRAALHRLAADFVSIAVPDNMRDQLGR